MKKKKPKVQPEQASEWLRELEEQQRWVAPDATNLLEMRAACDFWWGDYVELAEKRKLAFSEDLEHFLILSRALAQTAEGQGIDSTPIITFIHNAEQVYYGKRSRLPVAGIPVHVLLDRVKFKLAAGLGLKPPPPPSAPQPVVVLQGQGKPVLVRGKEKEQLTRQQFVVVQVLLDAGTKGLSKKELDRKSNISDARKILKRLSINDPDWQLVIQFPGKPGCGYRIG